MTENDVKLCNGEMHCSVRMPVLMNELVFDELAEY
jgi:hypothetical protein